MNNWTNVSRVEYDAYRTDLEYYGAAKDSKANQEKMNEIQVSFNNKKVEFEKLRSDVQIKLKFLDENRVSYKLGWADSLNLTSSYGYITIQF